MPLIKPEVQNLLRKAGIGASSENESASSKLDRAGLSTEDIAEELSEIAKRGETEAIRLRALETGLKVHGALKEKAGSETLPNISITIQNAGASERMVPSVNPIILPRQSLQKLQEESGESN